MFKTVVGQILEIRNDQWSRIITLETPLGDLVYLKYDPDAIGTTPQVGGVYAISYQVEDGTLRVVEVKKPAPGQYRAEFEKSAEYRRESDYHTSATSSRSRTVTSTPTYRPKVRSYDHTGRDTYIPTTSVTKGVRPNGISLIAVVLLIIGTPSLTFALVLGSLPFAGLFGIVFGGLGLFSLILAWGVYTYRDWARSTMLVISVFLCITVVGLIIGVPLFWYLDQKHIKRLFVF